MPRVELTPRLARESRPGGKDTILYDKRLPGFGLRVHPSGRKVWIIQARIEGRSRRIVIARHGEMELAEARRRVRGRVPVALRTALEVFGTQDRAHLSQGPHPAEARQDAAGPYRRTGRGCVVRRGQQEQARCG